MTRLTRIEELFAQASDLPLAERAGFVAKEAGDDAPLREEVMSLLSHAIGAAETISSAVAGEAAALAQSRTTRHIGRRIGPYKVTGLLGEGGMGAVYAAERAHEFDQRVAIKVLPFGLDSAEAVARFRDERQILASLEHPNIVRLLDGGRTEDDLPYLVMERIAGMPITAYAIEHALPVAARVRLFREVCSAVQFAHGRLVVHRDLKPSNIFVDMNGTPKLLDFGIAKLVDPLATRGTRTRTGMAPLTPQYASPEQAAGGEVSFASDIYSLGVVLRELASPGIDSELETIVLKAMRDEPEERYLSVEELADDLGRYLAGLPVRAHRPTLRYRARKYVARHRVVIAAIAAVAVAGSVATVALVHGRDATATLPAHDRRLAVIASTRGTDADDWLGPAVARIAARRLRDTDLRFTVVDDPATANVTARLEVHRTAAGVSIDATIGPRRLESVEAATVPAALDKLLPIAADYLGRGQPERGPDAHERAEMARLGTSSFAAYRAYTQTAADFLRTQTVNSELLARRATAVVALDPGWAHAYLLQLWIEPSDQVGAQLASHAREVIDHSRDPDGLALLEAAIRATSFATQVDPQETMRAIEIAEPIVKRDPDDLLAAWTLESAYGGARERGRDFVAFAVTLHERYPELRFGSDLANAYRLVGRTEDADRVVREWFRTTPQAVEALAARRPAVIDATNADTAVRIARDLVFLHGETHDNLLYLCDALIAADRTREAGVVADRLLTGTDRERAQGRNRIGVIAIAEGRFASALEALASPGETDDGNLGLAHELAERLGETAEQSRIQARLDKLHAGSDDQVGRAATRFSEALQHGCPDIDAVLAQLPADSPIRNDARRWLARTASTKGCVPCAEVVHMGMTATEFDSLSLLHLVECAEHEGELALATDAIDRLLQMRSPIVGILAHYHRGRVLERLGKPAEARTEYQAFLAHWDHADHPLPEVDDARAALARLPK